MDNKLPEKYEKGLLCKIKKFLLNIFNKKRIMVCGTGKDEIKENFLSVEPEENYFEKMKKESKKENIKQEILDMIDKKPELIRTLTTAQLRELNNIYDKLLEESERKIKQLRREIEKANM